MFRFRFVADRQDVFCGKSVAQVWPRVQLSPLLWIQAWPCCGKAEASMAPPQKGDMVYRGARAGRAWGVQEGDLRRVQSQESRVRLSPVRRVCAVRQACQGPMECRVC